VLICPGLAVSLVIRDDPEKNTASVMLPWELPLGDLKEGSIVQTVDEDGAALGEGLVTKIKLGKYADRRYLFTLRVPYAHRLKAAGFRVQPERAACAAGDVPVNDGAIVCRCSRVTKAQIVGEIRAGVRDLNQLKASVRSGMGACGGNTCTELILRLYREEGVDLADVARPTQRPLGTEVPLGILAGLKKNTTST
jgi:bacterioferritin-associated ferredoxin